jgi:hypothetical protein
MRTISAETSADPMPGGEVTSRSNSGGVVKVVASNNSFVYDELGGAGFRLVNTRVAAVAR